jgi:hypothetical protein
VRDDFLRTAPEEVGGEFVKMPLELESRKQRAATTSPLVISERPLQWVDESALVATPKKPGMNEISLTITITIHWKIQFSVRKDSC